MATKNAPPADDRLTPSTTERSTSPIQPLAAGEPTTRVTTTVEERLHEYLAAIAAHNGTTVADLSRHALWMFATANVDSATGEPATLTTGPGWTVVEAGR